MSEATGPRRFERWPRMLIAAHRGGPTSFEAYLASTARRRTLGLALLASPPGRGVLIPRCASVHTFGMRFPIDAVFVAWEGGAAGSMRVLEVRPSLPPGRIAILPLRGRAARRAGIATLELAAGRAAELGLVPGAERSVTEATTTEGR